MYDVLYLKLILIRLFHLCIQIVYPKLTVLPWSERATWLIPMYDVTHSRVRQYSFTCVTWHIHVFDLTHSRVWHDAFTCVTASMTQLGSFTTWQNSLFRCVCMSVCVCVGMCVCVCVYVCVCVCVWVCVWVWFFFAICIRVSRLPE